MLEIVATRGYEAVTARDLAQLAGVSSRAFYERFDSKEECFLRTHELIARRMARRLVASVAGEEDWREQVRLAFHAFLGELACDPGAGRLALIEIYAVGPDGLRQARRLERTFEERIEESFAQAPGGAEPPSLLVKGMVAGLVSVGRSRLLDGREGELPGLAERLTDWALALHGEPAAPDGDLRPVDAQADRLPLAPLARPKAAESGRAPAHQGERALFLCAVAKLVADGDYAGLSERRICKTAGASRRSFLANFAGVENCFLAALEQQAREALLEATRAAADAGSWDAGVRRGLATICARVASDPAFASLCFGQSLFPGASGIACRGRLVADVVAHLRDGAPAESRPDALTAEASVGAMWGVIQQLVAAGRAWEAPQAVPSLAHLALAPVGRGIGATAAAGRQP